MSSARTYRDFDAIKRRLIAVRGRWLQVRFLEGLLAAAVALLSVVL